MWEPVGPLPPSVYWRRRAVALGLAVVVLVGLIWTVVGTAGGDPTVPADPTAVEARARAAALERSMTTPTTEASARGPIAAALPSATGSDPVDGAAPVAAPGAGPGVAAGVPLGAGLLIPPGGAGPAPGPPPMTTTTPTTTPPTTTTTPPVAPPPATCADGALRITARTDATRYTGGRKPVLSLVVTNVGPAPCVRDLDAARQAVAVVRQPGDGLWGSNDCSPGRSDDVRTLAPGEEAVFSVQWSGRTSLPGCAGERHDVPPGDYQLLARLDDMISEPVPFTLAE